MLRKLKTVVKVIKGETMYKGLVGQIAEIEPFYIRPDRKTETRYWVFFPGMKKTIGYDQRYAWFHPEELRTV